MKDNNINLVDVLTKESLHRCFNQWGIEGTLEKIHQLCTNEAMLDSMLRNFWEIVRG